ncbi:MAG: hypothetical protein ABIA93_05870 [Candidatus Woesearchaeota archaeon]
MEKKKESEKMQEIEIVDKKPSFFSGKVKTYTVVGVILIAFIAGLLVSNYMKQGTIEQLNQGNKNTLGVLTAEKDSAVALANSEKQTLTAENQKLSLETQDLKAEVGIFDGLLDSLNKESKETKSQPYYSYEVTWQKYILAQPGEKFTTSVVIKNIGTAEMKFDLDIRQRSTFLDAITATPADGSLTLARGSSGNINLEFNPKKEGYALYSLYINNHHEGDMIVFVRNN